MRGLDISKQSTCFSRNPISATFAGLCFFCPIQTSKRPIESQVPREKQYRHVPTHAASSFLRTTTPPSMTRAAEPTLNDITLRNLDLGVVSNSDFAQEFALIDESRSSRTSLVETAPTTIVSDNIWPDIFAHEDLSPIWPASSGYSGRAEQVSAESPTLGDLNDGT